MRGILPHYVLGGSVSKEEVHAYIMQDEDLLFHRDILSGQLSHETARALKDFFLCSSFVVCKQLLEGGRRNHIALWLATL